jgi:hypothetical protein
LSLKPLSCNLQDDECHCWTLPFLSLINSDWQSRA